MCNPAIIEPGESPALPRWRFLKARWAIPFFLIVLGMIEVATVQKAESFGSDSSVYIVEAHNIRETGRFEFDHQPETKYPPGFPLMLAFASALTRREGYGLYIRLMPVFATLAMLVWYFVLRRAWGTAVARASCLLVATAGPFAELATRSVNSDCPFFLMSGLAVWFFMKIQRQTGTRAFARWVLPACFCVFGVFTVLTRSAGLAFSAALFAWAVPQFWLSSGNRLKQPAHMRAALLGGVCALLVLISWIGWTRYASRPVAQSDLRRTYVRELMAKDPHQPELGGASPGDLITRAVMNTPVQASHIAAIAIRLKWLLPVWYSPIAVATVGLLLLGAGTLILREHRSRRGFLAWYFLSYFTLYLFWPFDEGARFMLPICPVALVLIWSGAAEAGRLLCSKPAATLTAIAVGSSAFAIATAVTGRHPGLQEHTYILFWPFLAVVSWSLGAIAKPAGNDAASAWARSVAAHVASRRLQCGVVAVLIVSGLVQQTAVARANMIADPSLFRHYRLVEVATWLRNAGDGAVMTDFPAIMHRLTGRRAVIFPVSSAPKLIVKTAAQNNVRYVFVEDTVDYEYVLPTQEERWRLVERAYPAMFHLAHTGRGYRLFEFVH
jgi:hypothetical protein